MVGEIRVVQNKYGNTSKEEKGKVMRVAILNSKRNIIVPQTFFTKELRKGSETNNRL